MFRKMSIHVLLFNNKLSLNRKKEKKEFCFQRIGGGGNYGSGGGGK